MIQRYKILSGGKNVYPMVETAAVFCPKAQQKARRKRRRAFGNC
jgi:hypothetical protein